MSIMLFPSARQIPQSWDRLALSFFQKREFLSLLEEQNPCGQRYHLLMDGTEARAGCVTYSLRMNLLTYAQKSFRIPARICGIPCSQSWPGLVGEQDRFGELLDAASEATRGLFLVLNLLSPVRGWRSGATLPTIFFDLHYATWADYVADLRHSYRRRLSRICEKSQAVAFRNAAFSEFDERHYALYLNVFHASSEKLELLPLAAFQNLGDPFFMERCLIDEKLVGWYIALRDAETMVFFLCGLDYSRIATHELYLAILYRILRRAIEGGCARVEYGQTSEPSKLKVGGYAASRYMTARHSNPFLDLLLSAFRSALVYRFAAPAYHVLREQS